MKRIIKEYLLFAKAGFFKKTYIYLFCICVSLLIWGKMFGVDVEITLFGFIGSISMMDINEKRYQFIKSMPASSHAPINLLYINMLVSCFIGIIFSHIFYNLTLTYKSIFTSLFVYFLSVSGCSLYYALFASHSFFEDPLEQVGKMLATSLFICFITFVFIIIDIIIPFGLVMYMSSHLSPLYKLVILLITGCLSLGITLFSYHYVKRIVFCE